MENKYHFEGKDLKEADKTWGEDRFQQYMVSYPHLNNLASAQLLEQLVWLEIILDRIKKGLEDKVKKTADAVVSPTDRDYISFQTGMKQVTDLKKELGMFEDRKNQDVYELIKAMQEKFAEDRRRNPEAYKTTCPHCGRAFCLKFRTEDYEAFISPFFEDKILNNRPLMELYHAGIINKDQTAKVLGTNPKYIDWLDVKVYKKKVAEEKKEEPPASESTPTNQ